MTREPELLSRYLDGEIELSALPEALRREALAFERVFGALQPRPVRLPHSLRPAVMARVREAARPAWRRALDWAFTPRTVRLTPAIGGLAVVATAAALLLLWPRTPPAPGQPPVLGTTRFVLLAPEARTVAVTGDFTGWDPAGIPLVRAPRGGTWVAEIALTPGLHHYVFVIDGAEWRPDPNAASDVDDGFGQRNSVLLLPAREES
jgi:hypothetical protein